MLLLGLLLGVPQDSLPMLLRASADSLTAGRVREAIQLAERYTRQQPKDSRGFLALGDAYMALFPSGRFRAVSHYRTAQRLAPRDPVPHNREALAGLALGGADGERLAADGLLRVLSLDPLFPGAWDRWLLLFRNSGGRRAMIGGLAPYAATPEVAARLARLHMEDGRHAVADSLLATGLARDPTNVAWLALRAQNAYEAGDAAGGPRFYELALHEAARDSTGALWDQVIGIATRGEYEAWPTVAPDQRAGWIRAFWARRTPDLFVDGNGRVAEHFARWRYARKHFPLLHPLTLYHRSALGRTLALEPSTGEREFHQRCEVYQVLPAPSGSFVPLPAASSLAERARIGGDVLGHLTADEKAALRRAHPAPTGIVQRALAEDGPFALMPTVFFPLGLDLSGVDTVSARIGYNLATGLDDRGITYLRYGPPDRTLVGGDNPADHQCNTDQLERWHYAALGWVRFAKPNAFSRGQRVVPDMVFRPMSEPQFSAVATLLRTDATSQPSGLEFGAWTAQFRGPLPSERTIAVVSTQPRVAALLVSGDGEELRAPEGTGGLVLLVAGPGRYTMLIHARDRERVGRLTQATVIKRFDSPLALSDLLLARAWDTTGTAVDRHRMLRHVERDLTFSAGDTIRVYAEIYAPASEQAPWSYHVTYTLLRTTDAERDLQRELWPGATAVEVERHAARHPGGTWVETLDIMPGLAPPGSYLLRVTVEAGQLVSNTSTIGFEVR